MSKFTLSEHDAVNDLLRRYESLGPVSPCLEKKKAGTAIVNCSKGFRKAIEKGRSAATAEGNCALAEAFEKLAPCGHFHIRPPLEAVSKFVQSDGSSPRCAIAILC